MLTIYLFVFVCSFLFSSHSLAEAAEAAGLAAIARCDGVVATGAAAGSVNLDSSTLLTKDETKKRATEEIDAKMKTAGTYLEHMAAAEYVDSTFARETVRTILQNPIVAFKNPDYVQMKPLLELANAVLEYRERFGSPEEVPTYASSSWPFPTHDFVGDVTSDCLLPERGTKVDSEYFKESELHIDCYAHEIHHEFQESLTETNCYLPTEVDGGFQFSLAHVESVRYCRSVNGQTQKVISWAVSDSRGNDTCDEESSDVDSSDGEPLNFAHAILLGNESYDRRKARRDENHAATATVPPTTTATRTTAPAAPATATATTTSGPTTTATLTPSTRTESQENVGLGTAPFDFTPGYVNHCNRCSATDFCSLVCSSSASYTYSKQGPTDPDASTQTPMGRCEIFLNERLDLFKKVVKNIDGDGACQYVNENCVHHGFVSNCTFSLPFFL
jgi:hypothetical protein